MLLYQEPQYDLSYQGMKEIKYSHITNVRALASFYSPKEFSLDEKVNVFQWQTISLFKVYPVRHPAAYVGYYVNKKKMDREALHFIQFEIGVWIWKTMNKLN